MDRAKPTIEKLMAFKVNINTSYKLSTSRVRVCVHKKTIISRQAKGKSAKLASCRHDQSVFFCVQQCPCNTRYFPFFFIYIANVADGENFCIFPPVKNCKKHHFPVNVIQTLQLKSLSKPCNTVKQKILNGQGH